MARFSFVPVTLNFADGGILVDDWNEIYTVPVGKEALVFSGHIANTDDGGQVTHPVWLGAGVGAAPTRKLINSVPIPYGASLNPGKCLFIAGETIFVKADVIYIEFNLNIMLKAAT